VGLIDPKLDVALREALTVLSDYLGELVLVGGYANALYRYHPLASPFPGEPIGTKDIDFATAKTVRTRGRRIRDLLIAGRFELRQETLGMSGVVKFGVAGDPAADLEFLAPLTGRSREPSVQQVQPGLTAQALRYLDLLLIEPWEVAFVDVPALSRLGDGAVRVPSPAA
jgi:hypothetical protein